MSFSIKDLVPWVVALGISILILYVAFDFLPKTELDEAQQIGIRLVLMLFVPKLVILILKRFMKFKRF